MNARYVNPVSPWFSDIDFVSTLTHELVHAQQMDACWTNDRELVETTAQVVSLEILAAMANNGNRVAGLALLDELKGIVLSELRWQSLTDKSAENKLGGLLAEIDGPWERAEREQRWRYWTRAPRSERDFVFRAYAHAPYNLIVKALGVGHLDGLALAPVYGQAYPPVSRVPRVRFDDLQWFLRHAEKLYPGGEPDA